MVPEAHLEETDAGLVPATTGWFVRNARDLRWFDNPGMGSSVPLTGCDEYEAETFFPMLGILIVEGEERPVRQWDFVHCPPGTNHAFVGAGDGSCVLLCASSRQFQKDGPWGRYTVDEVARRYGASSPEETQDTEVADSRFPPRQPMRYREGWLPG
jgi:hypothetical protein